MGLVSKEGAWQRNVLPKTAVSVEARCRFNCDQRWGFAVLLANDRESFVMS